MTQKDEKIIKTKRTRKKKRTKTQEEKRAKLLSKILDKWVFVRFNYDDEDSYVFLKHKLTEGGSISKIEQILLSGDSLQDGVYLVTDYDIDIIYDLKTRQEMIQISLKKFDKKTGFDAEDDMVESFEELKTKLIEAKYLTEAEFFLYCQNEIKPSVELEEILLSYDNYNEDKEV